MTQASVLKRKGLTDLLIILMVIIVCKTFCFEEFDKEKANKEIEEWLANKEVISVTSDNSGGYGFGHRRTCITIIAKEEKG